MRAVAAIMVVGYHVFPQISRMGYDGPELTFLALGVDVFFVISGFIMWETTKDRPERTPVNFLADRFFRIAPIYYLITSLVVFLMAIAPSVLQTTRFDLWNVISSYLFFPSLKPSNVRVEPVLSPGWTLNYEMFFYLVFAAAMLQRDLRARASIIIGTLFALALVGALWVPSDAAVPVVFYTDSIVLEFGLGIFVSMIRGRIASWRYGWWLILIGFVALIVGSFLPTLPFRVQYALPAAAIVLGAALAPAVRLPILELLGNASYSIYLSHFLTMSAVGQLWRRLELPIWGFAPVAIAICVIVGVGCYYWVERPVGSYISSVRRRNAVQVAAT